MFEFRRRTWQLAAVALLPLMGACIESPEEVQLVEVPCTFTFSDDTTSMTKTSTGLFVRDLTVGTGDVVSAGSEVYVHYTGWLLTNGTRFDANLPSSSFPFSFTAGAGFVIPGFDQGVNGMRVGGCRLIAIPPSLGYGSTQNGNIPPNSWLVFEVGVAAAL